MKCSAGWKDIPHLNTRLTSLRLPGGYYYHKIPELLAWLHRWIHSFAALLESGKLKPRSIQENWDGLAWVIDRIYGFAAEESLPRSWHILSTIRQRCSNNTQLNFT
jgi:hypothetical protein